MHASKASGCKRVSLARREKWDQRILRHDRRRMPQYITFSDRNGSNRQFYKPNRLLDTDGCKAGCQPGFIHRVAKIIHVLGRRTEELDTIMGRPSTRVKGVPHRIIHSCTGIVDKSLRIPIAQPVEYCPLCYGLRKTESC